MIADDSYDLVLYFFGFKSIFLKNNFFIFLF